MDNLIEMNRANPGGGVGHGRFVGLFFALSVLFAGCSPLSINQEKRLGFEFSREIERESTVLRDRAVTAYVTEIGNRLLRGAGPQPFTFQFKVIADNDINAFAAPAGYIYVNTGLILKARDISELAGVMAHEIGHVVKRHIAHNYNRARATSALHQVIVLGAAVAGGGQAASAADAIGGLAAAGYLNSFGRDAEREADAFAVGIMANAGYDPRGLVSFFRILKQEGGGGGPSFLSSHPATDERIKNTNGLIENTRLPRNLQRHDAGELERVQRRIRETTVTSRKRRRWR